MISVMKRHLRPRCPILKGQEGNNLVLSPLSSVPEITHDAVVQGYLYLRCPPLSKGRGQCPRHAPPFQRPCTKATHQTTQQATHFNLSTFHTEHKNRFHILSIINGNSLQFAHLTITRNRKSMSVLERYITYLPGFRVVQSAPES